MARGGWGAGGGMPPGVRPLAVGDPVIIGRYLLLGRLGAGGMGVVYLAEHPDRGLVALKTPHPVHLADPTLRARFAQEVEFSRRMEPFRTAAPLEDGVDGERPYLVTEYIPGPALSQVVAARGPLPADLAYGVALAAAAALVAVHEAGLVHRDLKPGNVLLSPDGPYVIDFGIAMDLDIAAAHTEAGRIMGSPGWVAPERLMGGRALPASDVFSWGCLVAYAATGRHPFGEGEPDVLTRRIMVEEPRIAAVPRALWSTVAAALAKDPADRPGAAELLGALLAAGGVGAPDDLRTAVAGVLDEVWEAVPYPPGTEPANQPDFSGNISLDRVFPDGRNGQGASGGRPSRRPVPRRGGHSSHASFAALATVSIAAITVVAAGAGGVALDGTDRAPGPMPYVMPGETGTGGPGEVLGTRSPGGTPPVSPAARGVADDARPPVATLPAAPTSAPAATGHPHGYRWPTAPGDGPKPTARPTAKPTVKPPRPGNPGACGRKGRNRPCPSDSSTAFPSPTGSITQIPGWGDGESPTPTATATPAPAPSPTA